MSEIRTENDTNPFISLKLEMQGLAGLIKFPAVYFDVCNTISSDTFYEKVHSAVYSVLKTIIEKNENNNEKIDSTLLAQKLKELGINQRGEINIFDYVQNLALSTVNKKGAINSLNELSKLKTCRNLANNAKNQYQYLKENVSKDLPEIVSGLDELYNTQINKVNLVTDQPEELFGNLEEKIEWIADNPPDESKLYMGPFSTINRLFGSLHEPSAITVIGARSGVAKSSLGMFVNSYLAEKYNLPILNLDFGEMLQEQLQMRAVCMFTQGKVPYWAIKEGKWRDNKEWYKLVKDIWPRVKKIKFYFKDISGMSPVEIINYIRRFHYQVVGRDNKFLIHYDYLKPFDTSDYNTPEWKYMGHFIQDMKSYLKNEAMVPFWCSLQLNRFGITNNKSSNQVDDSENSFGISDRILQQSSFSFIVRQKLNDELEDEGYEFGNLKMIPLKFRDLGRDADLVLRPVKTGNKTYKKNYINLESYSFHFEDRGDLNHMIQRMKNKNVAQHDDDSDGELM